MRYLLTAGEMKRCDDYTSQVIGIPAVVLMERAALAVAEAADAALKETGGGGTDTEVLVMAGTGNNGADGLAAGRILEDRGRKVRYIRLPGSIREGSLFEVQSNILAEYGRQVEILDTAELRDRQASAPAVVIDALFGTGLARPLEGMAAEAVRCMEELRGRGSRLIAVDIPSGVSADTGAILGCAPHCDETVTFAFCKRGHYLYPGASHCGRLTLAQIGITERSLETVPGMYTYDTEKAADLLPPRRPDGHKGTFGKVLVIAGSRNMCGAALLCAESCARAGAGMVRLFTPECNRVIVQTRLPEMLLTTYDEEDPMQASLQLREALVWADTAVIGPGLGRSAAAMSLLETLLRSAEEMPGLRGIVMDADALRLLASWDGYEKKLAARRQDLSLVLTPHLAEFAALRHTSVSVCRQDTEAQARALAAAARCVVICKDARTLVCDGNGGPAFLNTLGNSGMATAGSGDVLAGICGAFLAVCPDPVRAAAAAVLHHARSGDAAAARVGQQAMLAGDIRDAAAPFMPRRTWAEVDMSAVRHNMDLMHTLLPEDAGIISVLKTDAYGHGAVPLARLMETLPYVKGMALATYEEARELRKAGVRKPLILLGYVFPNCYRDLVRLEIRPAVFREDMARQLSEAAVSEGRTLKIHIALDTGMSRIGITPDSRGLRFVRWVSTLPGLSVEGIFSHFARADEDTDQYTREQYALFDNFLRQLEAEGIHIPHSHIANSAGILVRPGTHRKLVRAGITQYGLWPSPEVARMEAAASLSLRPVLSWKSRIVYIKEVPSGTAVSYGGTYVTETETRIATIPVGYGDGYPRSLSGRGYVLIAGRRAPILGRVCMDQLMADVTDIPDAQEGSTVTLLGRDGAELITAETLGELSGRFNYELVCCIGSRVPRVYV